MNICIGGPWHMSQLLEISKCEKFFKVKDSSSRIDGVYKKR